jgi:uncharacterized protein involved in response to NO
VSNIIQSLLSYAFRVFFVLGTLCAFAVMLLWPLAILGYGPLVGHPNLVQWHSHEMVFGFAAAIIAGFTLTAVANWTGRPPVRGLPLGLLALAWLAGRIAHMFSGDAFVVAVAIVDMVFPCLLVFLFGREVLAGGNWRNAPVVAVIALLAGLNLMFHLGVGNASGMDALAILLAVHTVLVLVTIISGRIIPSFTANWLRAQGMPEEVFPRVIPAVDIVTILLTVVTGLGVSFAPFHPLTGVMAFAAAGAHALRLSRWSGLRTMGEPLMFVLHVAYAWFPIGYVLTGIAVFGAYMPTVALHALTIGGITGMVLAMTSRVTLGHTGRPLKAARLTVAIYVLWMATVIVRLTGPLAGSNYVLTVETAASIWLVVFMLFAALYWPMLAKPRID